MTVRTTVMMIIFGMAAVTMIPRIVPMIALTRRPLPVLFVRWLKHVPVAVLGALLAQSVWITDGRVVLSLGNPKFLAAFVSAVVGVWSRNLMAAVVSGVVAIALLRRFGMG